MTTTGQGKQERNVVRLKRKSIQRIEYEEISEWELAFEDEIENYPPLKRRRNLIEIVKNFIVGLCSSITANNM